MSQNIEKWGARMKRDFPELGPDDWQPSEVTTRMNAEIQKLRAALAAQAGQSEPEKQAAVQQELIAILREAADIINAIDPTHAPANIRWPIVDELDGFSLIVAHPAPVRQPLTHTEIVEAYDDSMSGWVCERDNPYVKFARAIEAKLTGGRT